MPARRRTNADGQPTLAQMGDWLRAYEPEPAPGLLIVEPLATGRPVGYCGHVTTSLGRPHEPKLAFEFLREFWGRGLATEASRVVVDHAAAIGHQCLASIVREWNTASLNVLDKLGFVDTGEREVDAAHGDSLFLRLQLR